MLFSEIPGLADLKQTLIQSVQNGHVAHAQLWAGNEGSANLGLALAYAQYLNCESPGEQDACGTCAACFKNRKLIHPDLHFVFPVTTTQKIAKDASSQKFLPDWRQFLLRQPYAGLSDWLEAIEAENKQPNIAAEEARQVLQTLSLKAFEGKYKVMLIWLPERLHPTAANVLLKVLEEPPPQTVFLLVSQCPDDMLPTILSRTQLLRIPDFSEEDIEKFLREKQNTEPEKARKISFLADGNLQLALKLLHDTPDEALAIFRQWMRHCYGYKAAELLDFAEGFQKMSKDEQKSLLEYGLQIFRDCLLLLTGETALVRLPDARLKFATDFTKMMSLEKIQFFYTAFNESVFHLERNASPKIVAFDLSLQVSARITHS
jgi:DNA polymerase III subunit delta'